MRTIDADALIRKLENNSPDPEGVDEWISIIEKEPTIDVAIPSDAEQTLQKIKDIINAPVYIQEDVLRYKMICEVIEHG